MATVRMVDAAGIGRLARELERVGVDPYPLLVAVGIDPAVLGDPDSRIAFRRHVAFLERAVAATGDIGFAVRAALNHDPREAGALGYLALSAASLGDALTCITRYIHIHSEGVALSLERRAGSATLVYRVLDPAALASRYVHHWAMASVLRFARVATASEIVPARVDFLHPAPIEGTAELGRLFGCRLRFGEVRTAIKFEADQLARPLVGRDDRLFRIMERYCAERLSRTAAKPDLVDRLRALVAEHLPTGYPDATTAAHWLGMSRRTLSRRLADRGFGYRALVEEVRRDLAERYLRDPGIRQSEIAYLLGFSEVAAFDHAFRRWTGQPPSAWRAEAADTEAPTA